MEWFCDAHLQYLDDHGLSDNSSTWSNLPSQLPRFLQPYRASDKFPDHRRDALYLDSSFLRRVLNPDAARQPTTSF